MNFKDEIIKKINKKYSKKELEGIIPLIVVKLSKDKEKISDVVLFNDAFKDELFDSRYLIGDIYGNIYMEETDFFCLRKCGDNNFLIIRLSKNGEEAKHYRYDNEKRKLVEEFDLTDYAISFPINKKPELAILIKNWKYSLYSFKEGKTISPEFDSITPSSIENERVLFEFTDTVESNLEDVNVTENSETLSKIETQIFGLISEDGIMYSSVFIDHLNQIMDWDLNSDVDYSQYDMLKRTVSSRLDSEIEKRLLTRNEKTLAKTRKEK